MHARWSQPRTQQQRDANAQQQLCAPLACDAALLTRAPDASTRARGVATSWEPGGAAWRRGEWPSGWRGWHVWL
eukprot:727762-Alexandrium_andersonii.AAC.1